MKYKKFWFVTALFVLVAGLLSVYSFQKKQPLVYAESLALPAVTVDERTLTLGDLAYYIAAEELEVEKQARVYDLEDTYRYWGMRLKAGRFVKIEAKRLILDTAVCDEIFYQMAKKADITLDEEERRRIEGKKYDFWSDLSEEQRESLGISKQELWERMEEIALAQKYRTLYSMEHSFVMEDYEVDGEGYRDLLKEHTYRVHKANWNRLPFGEILFHHSWEQEPATE